MTDEMRLWYETHQVTEFILKRWIEEKKREGWLAAATGRIVMLPWGGCLVLQSASMAQ